jgi:hypothetical protein
MDYLTLSINKGVLKLLLALAVAVYAGYHYGHKRGYDAGAQDVTDYVLEHYGKSSGR